MFLGLLLLGYVTFPMAMYFASSGAGVPMDRYCETYNYKYLTHITHRIV